MCEACKRTLWAPGGATNRKQNDIHQTKYYRVLSTEHIVKLVSCVCVLLPPLLSCNYQSHNPFFFLHRNERLPSFFYFFFFTGLLHIYKLCSSGGDVRVVRPIVDRVQGTWYPPARADRLVGTLGRLARKEGTKRTSHRNQTNKPNGSTVYK